MARALDPLAALPHLKFTTLRFHLFVGAASLGGLLLLRSLSSPLRPNAPKIIPSPLETLLPHLSPEEIEKLPYPLDALPGARDVQSPYGSIRVYEWGPEDGDKILLIHGISTPSIAMADLAHKLVGKGCRVMLFDLFGRGYTSGPSPNTHNYSSTLYNKQIHIVLSSSPLPWTPAHPFTLIGYSLGGALALDFTSHFPQLIRHLVVLAPGGLIRRSHTTWKSKLLYSPYSPIPRFLAERLVAKRLWTGPETARSIEPEPSPSPPTTTTAAAVKKARIKDAVYASSHHALLPSHPHSTVSAVVDWQIKHHVGFVPAFISSIQYAPIHDQQARWRVVRENIENGVGQLRRVWVALGEMDEIIVKEEFVEDIKQVLGEENVRVRMLEGVGHEVVVERAGEIVGIVGEALGRGEW